jgi:hypothetical protein
MKFKRRVVAVGVLADRKESRFLALLGMTTSVVIASGVKAAVCRVNFVVKLLRAHGGCLGRSRR